jgi:hypothetical protein
MRETAPDGVLGSRFALPYLTLASPRLSAALQVCNLSGLLPCATLLNSDPRHVVVRFLNKPKYPNYCLFAMQSLVVSRVSFAIKSLLSNVLFT